MAVGRRSFLSSLWAAAFLPRSAFFPLSAGTLPSERGSHFPVKFVDVSREAGLQQKVYYGSERSWKYILETTGCGVAFIDYDNDGWLDIFVVTVGAWKDFPTERRRVVTFTAIIVTGHLLMLLRQLA